MAGIYKLQKGVQPFYDIWHLCPKFGVSQNFFHEEIHGLNGTDGLCPVCFSTTVD